MDKENLGPETHLSKDRLIKSYTNFINYNMQRYGGVMSGQQMSRAVQYTWGPEWQNMGPKNKHFWSLTKNYKTMLSIMPQ